MKFSTKSQKNESNMKLTRFNPRASFLSVVKSFPILIGVALGVNGPDLAQLIQPEIPFVNLSDGLSNFVENSGFSAIVQRRNLRVSRLKLAQESLVVAGQTAPIQHSRLGQSSVLHIAGRISSQWGRRRTDLQC